MNPADLVKATAQAIVNIFETGSPLGDYGKVTLLKGDKGGLTYGRSQTTLNSGSLYLLVKEYCGQAGALYGPQLQPFLSQLQSKDPALNQNATLQTLLRSAGDDPVMISTQDAFFDRAYWDLTMRHAANANITDPLGLAIVYDSTVQGGWLTVRNLTSAATGKPTTSSQRTWLPQYVARRKQWLLASQPPLPATTYRMDAFAALLKTQNWELTLPVTVRGVVIDLTTFNSIPPARRSG